MIGLQIQTKYPVSNHTADCVRGDGVTCVDDACESLWIFSVYTRRLQVTADVRLWQVKSGPLAGHSAFPRPPIEWLMSPHVSKLMGHTGWVAISAQFFGTIRRWVVSFAFRLLYPGGKIFKYPLNRRLDGSQGLTDLDGQRSLPGEKLR